MKNMLATLLLLSATCHASSNANPSVLKELKRGIREGDLYVIVPILYDQEQTALLNALKKKYFISRPGFEATRRSCLAELEALLGTIKPSGRSTSNQRKSTTHTIIERPER